MTDSNINDLNLLGKYVSFSSKESLLNFFGVINSVTYYLDGKVEIGLGLDDFYFLSDISHLKILGTVDLL